MSPQRREAPDQQLSEVVLELPAHKGVENGADTEVERGQVAGDVGGVAPALLAFAAGVAVPQQLHHVEGRPADEEEHHDDKNQPHRLELAGQPGRDDGDGDPHVAVDDDHQGEEQEEEDLRVERDTLQEVLVQVRDVQRHLVAVGFVVVVDVGAVDEQVVEAGQHADQPHHQAGDHGVAPAPEARGAERVDHGQVTVEGEQGEEEHGAVEAQEVEAAVDLAHGFAKDPLCELQVDALQGEAAHEEQAGDDQVEQQDVGDGGQPLEPAAGREEKLSQSQFGLLLTSRGDIINMDRVYLLTKPHVSEFTFFYSTRTFSLQ